MRHLFFLHLLLEAISSSPPVADRRLPKFLRLHCAHPHDRVLYSAEACIDVVHGESCFQILGAGRQRGGGVFPDRHKAGGEVDGGCPVTGISQALVDSLGS